MLLFSIILANIVLIIIIALISVKLKLMPGVNFQNLFRAKESDSLESEIISNVQDNSFHEIILLFHENVK